MSNSQRLLVLEAFLHLDMSYLSDQILKKGVRRYIPNLAGRVGITDGLKIFLQSLRNEKKNPLNL